MRRNIVEGEPGIFPAPVARFLVGLNRRIRRLVSREPRRLKLMWEQDAFPLREADDHSPPISIASLPLSEELRSELQRWSDERTNATEPQDDVVFETWDRRGRELLERVRAELASAYEVGYFNERTDEIEWP